MRVLTVVCGPLQANCHLLAGEDGHCLIIDPGQEAGAAVEGALDSTGLEPVAILATHGHLDHVAEAALLGDRHQIPVWIHALDRPMLTDPMAGLGPTMRPWVEASGLTRLEEPALVELFDGDDQLDLAGLRIQVVAAPGHTPGSVLYLVQEGDQPPIVFSGDVLFAGSIGRTDLRGGDMAQMAASLRGPVAALPDGATIVPGHGRATTMARERATNPYLQAAFLDQWRH